MPNNNSLLLPPDEPPVRADARRNRELLLDTAKKLFEAEGVEAVSMTAIADTAGVGKGTLYRHFDNKADVCNALLDEDQRRLQNAVLQHMAEQSHTPPEKTHWFLEQILRFVLKNVSLLSVEEDAVGIGLEHPAHYWWRQTLLGLLQRQLPGEDVSYRADVLYVMLDVRTIQFQQRMGYDEAQILSGLQDTADRLST